MKWMQCAQITVLTAAINCGSVLALAQANPSVQADPGSIPATANSDGGPVVLDWVPPALAQLSSQAVAKESFSFDRNMLAVAAGLIPDSDADVRQTVAKLAAGSVYMLS